MKTVLNNETNQKEIIIETTSNFKFESFPHIAKKVYLIKSFRALKYAKIRFYINSIKEYSGAFITKLEIIFSDYLEGHKLCFQRTNSYIEGVSPNYVRDYYPSLSDIHESNYATYELDSESGKTFKIITENVLSIYVVVLGKCFLRRKRVIGMMKNLDLIE